jgi:hypothetical protein
MKKETAVEYTIQEIEKLTGLQYLDEEDCVIKAKELEKQQIIDAFRNGDSFEGRATSKDAEQYYRENFKDKEL